MLNKQSVHVQSSNIEDIEYDVELQELTVKFLSGSTYVYFGVPEAVWEDLMNASSKGSYFYHNIRNTYSFKKQ